VSGDSLRSRGPRHSGPRVASAIARYDELWSEWRQLRADHPDTCASLYTDRAFGDKPGRAPPSTAFDITKAEVCTPEVQA